MCEVKQLFRILPFCLSLKCSPLRSEQTGQFKRLEGREPKKMVRTLPSPSRAWRQGIVPTKSLNYRESRRFLFK